ncbi:GSK3-beta interaction protein [Toxocara canis]|uniref:GSK3-beta interaction protein n=1 Tax=Toxocara canis TaxID=6265 RepID=A0A0B2V9U5_TOXCA|nr:GSK3-beta interaction protein [Toxocara canis]
MLVSEPVPMPCVRCGGTPPFACSLPSLSKVSSHNRSLHSTNPHSRGDSSLELEAIAAVHELSFAVQSISVSEMLPRTPELIFVNVTTIEGQPYCLELTMKGWRVTSLRHDCMQGDFTRLELFTKYFDTLYELMDEISPGYRSRFSEKLAQKLRMLQAGEDVDFVAPTSSYACTPLPSDSPLHFHAHSLSPFSSSSSPFTIQENS